MILSGIVGVIVGGILVALGIGEGTTSGGISGLIGLLLTLLIAFFISGYVAGRMASRTGLSSTAFCAALGARRDRAGGHRLRAGGSFIDQLSGVTLPGPASRAMKSVPQQGLVTILTFWGILALLVPFIGGALGR